ncbi:macrodomain Ori organization protein MaoP [Alteromonas pelagimontana]|uniref:Macrodomain Ori protein n=1 Tax=Alteromonas pelagimontana TaxID=1858656 RepID=A0A6M4MED1_9ALTE|nr:DUF413 domain-containing protein [Alteromonas pelagimontana]QJR80516.1 macrodomain Ori organization protein MaoP [Alteromonas pelagimontana]
MTQLTRASLVQRPFIDRKHYPYGFARSGDFSIGESKLLTQWGSLISALIDGELQPENSEEQGYIDAALGRHAPQTPTEKAWVKYQQRINRPKAASIYGSKKAAAMADDDDRGDDHDTDLDIDDD